MNDILCSLWLVMEQRHNDNDNVHVHLYRVSGQLQKSATALFTAIRALINGSMKKWSVIEPSVLFLKTIEYLCVFS